MDSIKWTRKVADGQTKYEAEAGGARWLVSGRRMVGDSRVWYSVYRSEGGRVDCIAGGSAMLACRTLAEAKALVTDRVQAVTA